MLLEQSNRIWSILFRGCLGASQQESAHLDSTSHYVTPPPLRKHHLVQPPLPSETLIFRTMSYFALSKFPPLRMHYYAVKPSILVPWGGVHSTVPKLVDAFVVREGTTQPFCTSIYMGTIFAPFQAQWHIVAVKCAVVGSMQLPLTFSLFLHLAVPLLAT